MNGLQSPFNPSGCEKERNGFRTWSRQSGEVPDCWRNKRNPYDQWCGHFARARGAKAWNTSSVTPCLLTPSQPPPSRGRGKHGMFTAGLPGRDESVRTTAREFWPIRVCRGDSLNWRNIRPGRWISASKLLEPVRTIERYGFRLFRRQSGTSPDCQLHVRNPFLSCSLRSD